jgi:hypothetical protein
MSDSRREHLDAVEAVVKAFHYEPYDMAEEIIKLRAAIERVRALHKRYINIDGTARCWSDGMQHPCPTLRALDGENA